MPYINKQLRAKYDVLIDQIALQEPSEGELNYIITKILLNTEPKCYSDYNTLMGVLTCAQLELYRTQVAPYEELKAKENPL